MWGWIRINKGSLVVADMKVEDGLGVVCYSVGWLMDRGDERREMIDVVRLEGNRDKDLHLVRGRRHGGGGGQ